MRQEPPTDACAAVDHPHGRRPPGRRLIGRAAIVVGVALGLAAPVLASAPAAVDGPAGGGLERAEPVTPAAADAVLVYTRAELPIETMDAAIRATQQAGGTFAISSGVSIPMQAVRRGSTIVQAPPSGHSFPMSLTALPQEAIGRTISRDVSAVLTASTLVMGELTASLRDARAGDSVDLVASSGAVVRFQIAAVIADEVLGGTELMMNTDAAARLGLDRRSSILLWGFRSRSAIDAALAEQGLAATSIRIRRSWSPRDPDSGLGLARTKQALGEFAYRVNSNGSISVDGAWSAANLPESRRLLNPTIAIRARCHLTIEPALQAALAEVEAAGLGQTINVYDANRAGGCFNPRYNRLSPQSSIGFLSRHSWGMALDTNTVGSCQGCAPPDMNCDVVRIFRKHGFGWGGNYLVPDGMHFEWVGERRDLLPYPSRFCPNTVGALTRPGSDPPLGASERAELFVDHGVALDLAHAHGD